MNAKLRMEVYRSKVRLYSGSFERPIVLGRQLDGKEKLYEVYDQDDANESRLAIEPLAAKHLSRRQLQLRPDPAGIVVRNLSQTNALYLDENVELPVGEERTLSLPCQVRFGPLNSYGISIWSEDEEVIQTREHEAPFPGKPAGLLAVSENAVQAHDTWSPLMTAAVEAPSLNRCLMALMSVLELAANSDGFYERAAQALVNFGLHSGQVLLLDGDKWEVRARKVPGAVSSDLEWKPSLRVLQQVRMTKRSVWTESPAGDHSQKWIEAVVAAPIRNRHGEVIGALYGDRRGDLKGDAGVKITDTDVTLIEVLGYGIALGIERVTQERVAAEQRVLFEQFFSRKLSEQLAVHPNLLKGRDAEVTVLFCDIRSFSRRAKELGTELTLLWIQDVLEELSQCVLGQDGVVVDYTGDEVMAMWGAPVPQPDQAQRACQAATDILRALPRINERWASRLNEPVQVSIGINTGTAQVGNIGSKLKFKYGPLGHPVNLASRVQGANKFLKTSALITQATRDCLPSKATVRRICAVQVVNIAEPVNLFELRTEDDEKGRKLCDLYERALTHFEAKEFRKAARVLGEYLPDYGDDGPSHILLWRAVNWLIKPQRKFRRAWRLPGK